MNVVYLISVINGNLMRKMHEMDNFKLKEEMTETSNVTAWSREKKRRENMFIRKHYLNLWINRWGRSFGETSTNKRDKRKWQHRA